MTELEVFGSLYRIRELDQLNLTIDERRLIKSPKGEREDWAPLNVYFHDFAHALMWIYERECRGTSVLTDLKDAIEKMKEIADDLKKAVMANA